MKEKWKIIEGWKEYAVSDQGRIKRIKTYKGRIQNKILKFWIDSNGYCRVQLCHQGTKKNFRVHRLVLEAFVGKSPEGYQCNHLYGIKTDNRLTELEWCSASANIYHAYHTGLHKHYSILKRLNTVNRTGSG